MAVSCPEPEVLAGFLLGKLDEPEMEPLADHFVSCAECLRRADEIAADDPLISALRGKSLRSDAADQEISLAVTRVAESVLVKFHELSLAAPTLIAAAAGEATASQVMPCLPPKYDLRFLSPAETEGELGRLNGYRILQVLGAGGMGLVLLAEDLKLQRRVALKVIKPEIAADAAVRGRFLREARTAASIEHDNIITIYQVGEDNGVIYLAMKLLSGESLQKRLNRERQLSIRETVRLGGQLATGLQAAHARGLTHRDIKPDNIWLEAGTGRAIILDFGLARSVDAGNELTQSGVIVGTPQYLAPEQAEGQGVDQRADLFSLGVVLYRMLTGESPFARNSLIATLMAIGSYTPQPPHVIRDDVPRDLSQLVMRLLEKDPEKRVGSASALLSQLKEMSVRLRQKRRPPANASPAPTPAPSRRQPFIPWKLVVVAGLLPLVLLSVLVFFVRTEAGTLRFEIHDPQTTVSLQGTEIVLKQSDGVKPIRISPGARTLLVERGDFRFETDKLILKKGETVDVRVELLAGTLTVTARDQVLGRREIESPARDEWHGGPVNAPPPAIAPFDATQARGHQQAWAEYLKLPLEYTNSIGMTFRLIPPGEFLMGSTGAEVEAERKFVTPPDDQRWHEAILSESPQHRVVLTRPFYLGIHEVTQGDYEAVMGKNPSHFATTGAGHEAVAGLNTKRHPVEMTSANDAAEFCSRLSERERLKPVYFRADATVTPLQGNGYRLPTEAEWEFACRAGTTSPVWSGTTVADLIHVAWFLENSGARTHPVGQLPANPFGLFDIHGNVSEWVQDGRQLDWYEQFRDVPAIDPSCPYPGNPYRPSRGGNYRAGLNGSRSAYRIAWPCYAGGEDNGFRVALPIEAVRELIAVPAARDTGSSSPASQGAVPSLAVAPFDALQARRHQQAWAEHLQLPVEFTSSIGMTLRLIPPGTYVRGSTSAEIEETLKVIDPDDQHWRACLGSESPQHTVVLNQPFYVGVTEVTQLDFERVTGRNPSHFSPTGEGRDAVAGLETRHHPVENVTWNDAAEFCTKLSQQEQLKPFYFHAGETITPLNGIGYRLPTEAEWEFACRAGTNSKYWIGDQVAELLAAGWCGVNSGDRTHTVGELQANPFGLFDVHGNVREWVHDGWEPTSYSQFENDPAIDPAGSISSATPRLIRGGHFLNPAILCRSAHRYSNYPPFRNSTLGFRVTLTAEGARELQARSRSPSTSREISVSHQQSP